MLAVQVRRNGFVDKVIASRGLIADLSAATSLSTLDILALPNDATQALLKIR